MKEFCEHGKSSFLTDDQTGDGETFCMHAVRFCMPQLAEKMLNKCNVGLGVFTMQGFEHRNKESKNAFSNKTNAKGNMCKQSVKALFTMFQLNNIEQRTTQLTI